jgi:hypothetical protein
MCYTCGDCGATNLETIPANRAKLTALPLNIPGTSCIPCRAVVSV